MRLVFIIWFVSLIHFAGNSQTLLELNRQFVTLFQQGKYEEAIPIAERAFELAKKELNEDQPDYASMVNNLGVLYFYMGKYKKAEPLYLEALAIRKNALGENDPDYATSLDNLGALYAATGEYEKAESYYRQAMGIRKRVLKETDDDFITSLNNMASLYLSLGEYAKAEPLYLQALSVRKKTLGENDPEYATSLNNLGALYLVIGQYEKAETLFGQAMEIRRRVLGENHPAYLVSMNNLAQVYSATEQYQKAINLCIQTIFIRKNILGPDHPEYATSLNNLGVLYAKTGEYKKAEPYCEQAAAIRKRILGDGHPDYAESLTNLALIYKEMNQYSRAESLYIQAGAIYKKANGEKSLEYSTILNNLAILYITIGEYAKAEPITILSSSILLKNITSTFAILSEKEKGNYLNNENLVTAINNSLLYQYAGATPSLKENNFNLQLALKSLSLADTKNMIAAIRSSKDSAVKKIFTNWLLAKGYLAKQYSLPVDKRDPDLNNKEAGTEEMEKELTRKSAGFRDQQSAIAISLTDVQKNLQENEVAIEFVRFPLYSNHWSDSVIYAAFILHKNKPEPQFVSLCEEKKLQQLFDSAGRTATSMVSHFYRGLDVKNNSKESLGTELYKLVWKPLESYLGGVKKIDYSPAGKLYSIAFQALQIDSTNVLMDKYQLQQYTSIRQVALHSSANQNNKPGNIILFGNARFTMDSLQLVKQRNNPGDYGTNQTAIYTPQKRSGNTGPWNDLPGTAEEVNKIKQLFDQNKLIARSFVQTAASEENLKALNGNSPQVLHIATHGFFLSAPATKKNEKGLDQGNTYTLADDPLLRSGLILAGANYAWSGKTPLEGIEDGIVTAYEISQLNLSNTELVVLSACETALGEIKGSEGVFGLQRAIKMAGVKKMIVSLWQVPDKETAELMTTFYSYWMKGKTINDAFMQAQADMRKKYTAFYWAAFVLVE